VKVVTLYIFNQLLIAALAITTGLTIIVWLIYSLRWIDFIVNRGLPITVFLTFVGLALPSLVGFLLPIAAFCAVLFIYHKLVMDSEMVVLRAAGLSQMQLARPALVFAGLGTLVVYSIMLYFLPASYHKFKELQYDIRNNYATVVLQAGTFNTVSEGITIYVRARSPDGELRGILVHDNRDPKKPVTRMAEFGSLVQSEQGPRAVLINGNSQQIDPNSGRLSLLTFDQYTMDLPQDRGSVRVRWRQPKERFLADLLNPSTDPGDRKNYNELVAEGHQRLIAPLYVLGFVMIALAALLSGEFSRRGQKHRLLVAFLFVAVIEGLSLAFQDLASRSLYAVFGMYAVALLPMLGAAFVLMRVTRRSGAAPAGALLAST
jgi:lipopolysaccharide export system permease protein